MPVGWTVRSLVGRLACEKRGQLAVTTALVLPVACVLAALAVDEGAIYAERRNMQGLTDLAAITAATTPGKAAELALRTFADNGFPVRDETGKPSSPDDNDTNARIETGRYDRSDKIPVDERFTPGERPVNAVRVTLTRSGTQYFSAGFLPPPHMQTTATAHTSAEASFSVGSRLLALDEGIANAVLGALLGAKLSLSIMDYRALANARVDVPALLDWSQRSLNVQAATFSDLLRTDLPLGGLIGALATLPGLDKAAVPPLRAVAAAVPKQQKVRLGDLFDLEPAAGQPSSQRGLAASAAAADILGAALAIANRKRQVDVALVGGYPGVLGVTLRLAIGEPLQASPWLRTGEEGTVVRTAQTRLLLTLDLHGPDVLLGTTVRLPIYAEVASAEARLADIRCRAGRPQPASVILDATPGLARLRIADVEPGSLPDFANGPRFGPASLVMSPFATITGTAFLSFSDSAATRLAFSTREITQGVTKQVSAHGLVASPALSLLEGLRLDVKGLGLGAGLPPTTGATLAELLAGHAKTVDTLLDSVLTTLGISLGQADVTVNGAVCHRSVLVQ